MKEAEGDSSDINNPRRGGLYLHIAYCRRKCIYCDFFSAGDRIADWHRYVDALCSEFKERIKELTCPLRTVYFGGGTPSLMPEIEFLRLTDYLKPYINGIEEFTIEVNPDDVNKEKLEVWKQAGVNRISIGIQSFNDSVLSLLGRRHDAETAKKAYGFARSYFKNVSIDLMFGLPGQTIDMWKRDIEEAIAMRPEHISAYSLMYEEGTALTLLRDNGKLAETDDESVAKMFLILIEELKKAGYDHYEISNFALPGFRSRHNSSYWLQMPYIGLGPSAHSYDGYRIRKANRADIKGYIASWEMSSHIEQSIDSSVDIEILSDEELLEEYVMTRLRMREGIPIHDFKTRFGDEAYGILTDRCIPLIERGLIETNDKNISLSESAILISDSIILDILKD